ncbi:MAG: hypothetical protein ABSH49_30755 [Bryobacteraceae bacterium]|jgi:hypothetical protein
MNTDSFMVFFIGVHRRSSAAVFLYKFSGTLEFVGIQRITIAA